MTAAANKKSRGERQDLAPATEPVGRIGEGPAMAALNERQKKFVMAMFEAPRNHGSHAFAVRAAGYGTPTSSKASIASLGYKVANDPKVQLAIAEMSKQYVTTLGPLAVRALKKVLDTPAHRDFGRAIGIVIERVSPQQSNHVVDVRHDIGPTFKETAIVMARIAELAAKFCVTLPAPVVIDATANEGQPCR
jgi:hypothetical protein